MLNCLVPGIWQAWLNLMSSMRYWAGFSYDNPLGIIYEVLVDEKRMH